MHYTGETPRLRDTKAMLGPPFMCRCPVLQSGEWDIVTCMRAHHAYKTVSRECPAEGAGGKDMLDTALT